MPAMTLADYWLRIHVILRLRTQTGTLVFLELGLDFLQQGLEVLLPLSLLAWHHAELQVPDEAAGLVHGAGLLTDFHHLWALLPQYHPDVQSEVVEQRVGLHPAFHSNTQCNNACTRGHPKRYPL